MKRRYLLELARRGIAGAYAHAAWHGGQAQNLGVSTVGTPGPLCDRMNLDSKTTKTVYDRIWQSAESKSMSLSARITKESTTQGRGDLGASVHRVTSTTMEKVEHIATIGLVREFPKDKYARIARKSAAQTGSRINDTPAHVRVSFHSLAEHYLKARRGGCCSPNRRTPSPSLSTMFATT